MHRVVLLVVMVWILAAGAIAAAGAGELRD